MHVDVVTATGIETLLLRGLADSEIDRLLMELGMIAANQQAAVGPTLFILEANVWRIDANWLKRYAELLGSPTCRFQTIVSIDRKRSHGAAGRSFILKANLLTQLYMLDLASMKSGL